MAATSPTGTVPTATPPRSGRRLRGIRLARRAARGDASAFEQIFQRHHQELYRHCLAILRNRDDAEDALQATMAAALRALPGEDRDIDIRPWLFRIAHNESISLLRRRPPEAFDELEVPEREGATQEDLLETRERVRRLVADLNDLPERQCSALVMRELSGLSYGEIADALSCSAGGARQAVFEARTALREREEGRAMDCEEIRRAISDRDGRRLRARRIRAHLRGCDGCRAFAAAIPERRADLQALCPPLPTAAAGTMLAGLLGSGGGAATGAGAAGIAGGGIAATAAIKGASIAAAVALAVGAADVGGLIDVPNPIGAGKGSPTSTPVAAPRHASGGSATSGATGSQPAEQPRGVAERGSGRRGSGRHGNAHGGSSMTSAGNSADPPAAAQGSSSGSSGSGNSEAAPGQTGAAPGGGSADAPGQTGAMPGNASNAPGHAATSPGNSGSAPGQTGSTPPGQIDNPGNGGGSSNGGAKSK
jgi:RNA polymerase sigma factor (sigma-70 family)